MKSGKKSQCKPCVAAYRKSVYERDQEVRRKREQSNREYYQAKSRQYRLKSNTSRRLWLSKQYGISLEEYDRLYERQNGLCAICHRPESIGNDSLAVDHDHTTGRIRGLLCRKCNSGIGFFEEDTNLIEAAIEYLCRGGLIDGEVAVPEDQMFNLEKAA